MTPKISGYTVVRNAIKGDYCLRECVWSLLPLCDEVVICDSDSDDGTRNMIDGWAQEEPKIRIVNMPWVQPVREAKWFVRWINYARSHLEHSYQVMLDADEVLCSKAHDSIRNAASTGTPLWFSRLNFWKNGKTLIAHGETCGHEVVRCGPSHFFMPSDEPYMSEAHPEPEPPIKRKAIRHEPLPVIFHYGFIRKREGALHKSKVNLMGFFGGWDKRLTQAALNPNVPWQDFFKHQRPYLTYNGEHPRHCHAWLNERGAL